jgi:hypothetical protein
MSRVAFFLLVFFLAAFSQTAFAQKEFTIIGVMQHTDLEGGCWFIESKQMKYELTGTPEILQTCHVPGRMLTLRVHLAPMMASTCMLGHMVEVIEVLDTVFHAHNPPFEKKKIKGIVHMTKDSCWYVLAKNKKRYELQPPIPKKFMHSGAKYNRLSTVLPKSESQCDMDAVITISELDPDMKQEEARERKYDPR